MDDLLATLYVYRQTDRRGNCDIVRADDKNKAIINVNMALTALSRQLNIMSARQISKYSFNHDQCLRTAFGTLKQIRNKETAKHVQHIFHKTLQLDDLRTRVTEIFDVFVKVLHYFQMIFRRNPYTHLHIIDQGVVVLGLHQIESVTLITIPMI